MKTARLQILVAFFLTVSSVVTYRILSSAFVNPNLKQAQIAYQTEKLQLEREQLQRYDRLEAERLQIKQASLQRYADLNFYGIIGLLGVCGFSLLILAAGYSRAKVKRASVYFARIGQHSEIPIHQKDLRSFYPIAVNLSLAEIEASASTAHENAYRISRQMLDDITDYTRAIAGKRGRFSSETSPLELGTGGIPTLMASPAFADLLRNGTLASGKSLIVGYDRQGQPQMRALHDLKSLAIAGWQGSGKTLSMGYLIASSVLAYGVHTYVVDPHKHHPESISALLKPLEDTGHITVINPFDTPALLATLNRRLDRRLAGQEPEHPGILLVIDEMARLAKMECFDLLISFLERCTEETRKANITFIGGSPKWTARHFKGRADIRACMNSMLIHKSKPSQADLLLEDAHDKHLVKQIQRPGEAILVTDYEAPVIVSVPYCTRQDMETVANMIGQTELKETPATRISPASEPDTSSAACQVSAPLSANDDEPALPEVIPLARHRKTAVHGGFDPAHLTVAMLQEQIRQRKIQEPACTQAEIARKAGMSQSYLSRILNGQCPLNNKLKQRLYEAVFGPDAERPARPSHAAFHVWQQKKAAAR